MGIGTPQDEPADGISEAAPRDGQAFQLVATGNATLGFIALSQVMSDGHLIKGSAWLVPLELHFPLRQDAVQLNAGRSNPAAAALMEYLKSQAARATFRAYGYESPKP